MSTYGLSILGTGFHTVWASEFYSRSGLISMAAMAVERWLFVDADAPK